MNTQKINISKIAPLLMGFFIMSCVDLVGIGVDVGFNSNTGYLSPVGEWNCEEVYIKDTRIKVTLNGTVIVDGDIEEAGDNGTMDHNEYPGLKNKTCHIGFLGHGSVVKFRNIRIKDLSVINK
jgi:hypothetical protein